MWQVLKRLWLKNCARVKPQNSSKLFLLAPFWAPKLCQMFWKKTCHTQKNVVFFHVFQGIMVHFVRKYDVTKAGNSTFNFVQDTLLQVPSSCGDNQDGCQDSVVGWSKIGWELMQRVDVFCCCCQHETMSFVFSESFFFGEDVFEGVFSSTSRTVSFVGTFKRGENSPDLPACFDGSLDFFGSQFRLFSSSHIRKAIRIHR